MVIIIKSLIIISSFISKRFVLTVFVVLYNLVQSESAAGISRLTLQEVLLISEMNDIDFDAFEEIMKASFCVTP